MNLGAGSGRLAKSGCLLTIAAVLSSFDQLRLFFLGPRYISAELWLNVLAITLAVYGICLIAIATWNRFRDAEPGSFVDVTARKLVWWKGRKPAQRHTLPIDSIGFIVLELGEGGDRAILVDQQRRRLGVPPEVLPIPADRWADKLATVFQHITIDRKFF